MNKKEYYRPDEAAEILSVSTSHIYQMIKKGELRAVKLRTIWRIPVNAIRDIKDIRDIRNVS